MKLRIQLIRQRREPFAIGRGDAPRDAESIDDQDGRIDHLWRSKQAHGAKSEAQETGIIRIQADNVVAMAMETTAAAPRRD